MCEDMKLHSFTVSVDFEITCYSEEEARAFYLDGISDIVHVEDNGAIE